MGESAFDEAVFAYIRSDRRGMEVMRDPDVVERLYESLTRLSLRYSNRYRDSAEPAVDRTRLAQLIRDIEIERRAVRGDATTQRGIRRAVERTRADERRARKEAARLAESLATVQRLRAEIEAAQRKTARARAMERVRKAHEREYLQYVREEQAKDRAEGKGADVATIGAVATSVPPASASSAPVLPALRRLGRSPAVAEPPEMAG